MTISCANLVEWQLQSYVFQDDLNMCLFCRVQEVLHGFTLTMGAQQQLPSTLVRWAPSFGKTTPMALLVSTPGFSMCSGCSRCDTRQSKRGMHNLSQPVILTHIPPTSLGQSVTLFKRSGASWHIAIWLCHLVAEEQSTPRLKTRVLSFPYDFSV